MADFVYEPLAHQSSVRLVKFETSTDGDETPSPLHLQHFDPSSAPPYLALSYAWGDSKKSRHVVVNERRFAITQNLDLALKRIHDALPTLQAYLNEFSTHLYADVYLWIDAVCLNQDDEMEKSIQVGRMRYIYSSAVTTLVWLGEAFPSMTGERPEHLLGVLSAEPLRDSPGWFKEDAMKDFHASQNEYERLLTRTCWQNILEHDWFRRLWVIQEYTLSFREPLAMFGGFVFRLDALMKFGSVFAAVNAGLETLSRTFGDDGGFRAYLASDNFQALTVAEQLLWILINVNGRQTSVPHDHIYAILGLVKASELPENLLPDYSESYARVYTNYSQYIFRETGDLDLLQLGSFSGTEDDTASPSWTINVRALSYTHFKDRSTHLQPEKVNISLDGRGLDVKACKLHNVIMYWPAPLWSNLVKHPAALSNYLHQFHDKFLTKASEAARRPFKRTRRRWLRRMVILWSAYSRNGLASANGSLAQAMLDTTGVDDLVETLSQSNQTRQMMYAFESELQSGYLLLDDGNYTNRTDGDDHALQKMDPESDEVWVLKGAAIPFILQKDSLFDVYKLIGRCAHFDLRRSCYQSLIESEEEGIGHWQRITLV